MAPYWELRCKEEGLSPANACNFQPSIAKKHQKAILHQGNSKFSATLDFFGETILKVLIAH